MERGQSLFRLGRVREERGQTAAEFMGILLLVGLIIAALFTTDAAAKVATGVENAVCMIIGSDCKEGPPAGPTTPGLDDSDLEGPPLDDHPFLVLPFPGSVTITCTYDERDPTKCVPKGGNGVSVQASGELKVERTPATLDAEGCPWENLSIQTTLKLSANAEAKGAKAGGSLSAYLGQSTKYQLTVTPDSADAIADGDRPPPNPVDPTTIAAGESIQLSEDFYSGVNAKGSYRALQVEMGYDTGTRVSSGVKRISPTTVRVMVGDSEFVRQALKLGVGYKDVSLALGNTSDLSNGKLHAVDIDISNEAGWDAYQGFLESGKLPKNGSPGTTNPTQAETVIYSSVTALEAKLGGIKLGGQLNSSDGRLTVTTNADGTVDRVATARYGDVGLAVTSKQDANGDPIGTATRSLLLHDVDSETVKGLYAQTGQTAPSDIADDLRLDFTEPQLEQMRQLALSKLADKVEMNGERPTNEEIEQSLRDNHGVVKFDGVEYAFGGVESLLGAADNPDDALMALYHGGMSSGAVLDSIQQLLLGTDAGDLPIINNPSC
jgi:hypothetical protein